MRRKINAKCVITAVSGSMFALGLTQAHADTPVTWANAAVSGNWSDSSKWNPVVVPNGAYAVNVAQGSETVTVDISPTIDSLVVGTTPFSTKLTVGASQTLTVTGATTNSGYMVLGNGSVGQFADFTNPGTVSLGIFNTGNVACTFNVSGTFSNTGNLTSSQNPNGGDQASFGAIDNENPTNAGSLGFMKVYNHTTVQVAGDLTNGLHAQFGMAGGTTIESTGGNTVTVAGTLNNAGTLWVAGSNDMLNVNALTNTGAIYIGASPSRPFNTSNAQLTITGGGAGITTIPAGASYVILESGSLYGLGVVNSGVRTNGLANLTSIAGSLRIEDNQTYSYSSLSNTGVFALANHTVVNVSSTLSNQAQIQINTGSLGLFTSASMHVGSGPFNSANSFQQSADGVYNEIIGGSATSQYGQLFFQGAGALDGTLNVTLANGFVPAPGQTFTFLEYTNTLTGTYANITGAPYGGGHWQLGTTTLFGSPALTLTAVPEPTSLGLLSVGALALLRRRQRKA